MAKTLNSASTSYDDLTDVFYLTLSDGGAGRYEEDADGLVWRVDAHGHPLSVTVEAFHLIWGNRRDDLVALIAQHLQVDAAAVARKLPA